MLTQTVGFAQGNEFVFKESTDKIAPKEFFIENVIDNRAGAKDGIWLLNDISKSSTGHIEYQIGPKLGTFAAVARYFNSSVIKNKILRPVIIHLNSYRDTEIISGDVIKGKIELNLSFYMDSGNDLSVHLTDYKGTLNYSRAGGSAQQAEPMLRQILHNSIVYFNNWMIREAATNIKLAKAVEVKFADFNIEPESDTIYYSRKRPLKWSDFQSKVPNSRYDAQVFPSIGYEEYAKVSNDTVRLIIVLKVSLPKDAAWAKNTGRNAYTLNHEQRHFDIAKIASERFKEKIKGETLPVGNYEGFINVDYLDSYREMSEMQLLYDEETNHGLDVEAQTSWNRKIDEQLAKYEIK
jgi:hypothetical protein